MPDEHHDPRLDRVLLRVGYADVGEDIIAPPRNREIVLGHVLSCLLCSVACVIVRLRGRPAAWRCPSWTSSGTRPGHKSRRRNGQCTLRGTCSRRSQPRLRAHLGLVPGERLRIRVLAALLGEADRKAEHIFDLLGKAPDVFKAGAPIHSTGLRELITE